jgi:hypothetical protein
VTLSRTNVEVTAVDGRGLPAEVVFRFDQDLDAANLTWARWTAGRDGRPRFAPMAPPAIGARVRVD